MRLSFADTGMGMDEETLARAFEPYCTTKETGKGAGLGLAVVYGVARSNGGHVRIASKLAAGTTVEIFLPCPQSIAEGGPR